MLMILLPPNQNWNQCLEAFDDSSKLTICTSMLSLEDKNASRRASNEKSLQSKRSLYS